MLSKLDRAGFWIDAGFALVPCQPGSKYLVGGFGKYLNKITDKKNAAQWWGVGSRANLAVVAPDGFYILDFDIPEVYTRWAHVCPQAAQSYTETTPAGGQHVFLRGVVPAGVRLIDGAELKHTVAVCPSVVKGRTYKITLEHAFVDTDPISLLSPLSQPGHATPYALQASQHTPRPQIKNPLSRIEQIKRHFTISHVLSLYHPEIKILGDGEFQSCKCPFHADSKPSFYLSDSKGVWGCHACKIGGDVINLYARLEAVNVREAITRMWAVMS